MAADGSVLIEVNADVSKAEQKLSKMKSNIAKLEGELSKKEGEKSGLTQELGEIEAAAAQAYEELSRLTKERDRLNKAISESFTGGDYSGAPEAVDAYSKLDAVNKEIAAQEKVVAAMDKQGNRAASIESRINKINAEIEEGRAKLNEAQSAAGGLEKQIARAGSAAGKMETAMSTAGERVKAFGDRVGGLAKRVFVFSVLTAGFRAVRTWMGEMVSKSAEASAAMARLNGSLAALAQPILSAVIPAFVWLINVITAAIQLITAFFSLFSGAGDNAEGLYEEADAIGAVGGAAGKASKQLASFDTINKLSDSGGGGGGGGAQLDMDMGEMTELEDKFRDIAALVLSICAGLAGWAIGKELGLDMKGTIGLGLTLAGIVHLIYDYLTMWNEGVTMDGLSSALMSISAIIGGLYMLFEAIHPGWGRIAAGIGAVVAGLALFVLGVRDAEMNGINLANTLTVLAGILTAGLGISLITRSWFPLLIAGIAAVLVAITMLSEDGEAFIDGLWMVFEGFIQFFTGVFEGDFETAANGIRMIFEGLGTAFSAVIDALMGAFEDFMKWLNEKTGGVLKPLLDSIVLLFNSLGESIKQIFSGIMEFLKGVFTGDWETAWNGVKEIFKGVWNGIVGLIEGAANIIVRAINALIRQLNKIKVSIPDWVPGFGGKSFGINIETLDSISIPKLAQGAVIPPNQEFLAVLGDQKSGTNIEAPLSTIEQAVMNALARIGGGNRTIVLQVGERELGSIVIDVFNMESQRLGLEAR